MMTSRICRVCSIKSASLSPSTTISCYSLTSNLNETS
uniref:Uncharacterized protein n=1 Tax=Arundo donax TaxID=35708 RepID=A0A0A8Y7H2_ARUDO